MDSWKRADCGDGAWGRLTASSFAQHPEPARGSCPAAQATLPSFSGIPAG